MRDRGSESKAKIITRLESVILVAEIEKVVFAWCPATGEGIFYIFLARLGAINYRLISIANRRPIYRYTEGLITLNSEMITGALVTGAIIPRRGAQRPARKKADLIQPVFA